MESFSVVVYRARISPRLLAQGSKSDPTMEFSSLSRLFLELSVAAGSAVAANMERGSVPSSTLLSGSSTELEDEEDVEEVLPFRLTFLVFDSMTVMGFSG